MLIVNKSCKFIFLTLNIYPPDFDCDTFYFGKMVGIKKKDTVEECERSNFSIKILF